MRRLVVSTFVLLAGALSACDSVTPEEREERQAMFEASLPPLQVSAEIVGPSLVRDTLRIRVSSANAETPLGYTEATFDGEHISLTGSLDHDYRESVAAVSDMDGTFTFSAEVYDSILRVVDGDTLYANRTATVTLDAEIEQTIWRRGVTRPDPYYADNLTSVFPGVGGELWVHLSAYRSSFWSSTGPYFTRRREGFERYLDSDGAVAWVDHRTAGSGGTGYLMRVDLATGETAAQYRVYFNESIDNGAGLGDVFYGVSQGRRHVMHIEEDAFDFATGGPYGYYAETGVLLDYHISPDGVHWLATTARGVLRNDGTGWQPTSGLGSDVALFVDAAPDGRVIALAGEVGAPCVTSVWNGSGWDARASFDRDGNGSCGTVALTDRGSVWRATSDGWITRHTDGAVDRRYPSSGTAILVQGSTVWVATGDGLVEIDDY